MFQVQTILLLLRWHPQRAHKTKQAVLRPCVLEQSSSAFFTEGNSSAKELCCAPP